MILTWSVEAMPVDMFGLVIFGRLVAQLFRFGAAELASVLGRFSLFVLALLFLAKRTQVDDFTCHGFLPEDLSEFAPCLVQGLYAVEIIFSGRTTSSNSASVT